MRIVLLRVAEQVTFIALSTTWLRHNEKPAEGDHEFVGLTYNEMDNRYPVIITAEVNARALTPLSGYGQDKSFVHTAYPSKL